MSNTNTGGPMFPAPVTKPLENYYPGISIRDYFAAKAMQGFASDPDWRVNMGPEETARAAYTQADAMLRAREAT
jgi:hypothetical protein